MVYRVRQFLQALTAPLAAPDYHEIAGVLTRPQQALFFRMSPADRRHALAVYRTLYDRGCRRSELLVAALLHDVGKSAAPLPLWGRAVVVLLGRLAPALLDRLAAPPAEGWRRPFIVYRQHARLGAEWAAKAGADPLSVTLIRWHEETALSLPAEEAEWLTLLQAADDAW